MLSISRNPPVCLAALTRNYKNLTDQLGCIAATVTNSQFFSCCALRLLLHSDGGRKFEIKLPAKGGDPHRAFYRTGLSGRIFICWGLRFYSTFPLITVSSV